MLFNCSSWITTHILTHIHTHIRDDIFTCSIVSLSLITLRLSSLPHPHLDTGGSPLLQKLLIKVRASTTGQLKEGGVDEWMDAAVLLYLPSEPIFSFIFLYSSLNFFCPLLSLSPSVVEGSNFHEFDLMDRVVSLICNTGLTPRLKVLPQTVIFEQMYPIFIYTQTHTQYLALKCFDSFVETKPYLRKVNAQPSHSGVISHSHYTTIWPV